LASRHSWPWTYTCMAQDSQVENRTFRKPSTLSTKQNYSANQGDLQLTR
jgi:hypothetical protein